MENNEVMWNLIENTISIIKEDGTVKTYTENESSEYVKDTGRAEDIKILNWPSDFPSKHDKTEDYQEK
jgi:hypothetical protein